MDTYASPAWAPVSIGLESYDGFDGIQVAYDDHDWPRSGTAIGFSASCATAGENDCGADDLARATVSCASWDLERPECVPGAYGVNVDPSCGPAFCQHECFHEICECRNSLPWLQPCRLTRSLAALADNFHQDCLNNPRSTMSQEDQATFMQLVPPTLVAACPAPDSGTALPPGGGH